MLLKLSKHLFSQWVGDLRIHTGVADVPMSQVIGNILNTASGLKQVYSNRVAQRVYVSDCESCLECVAAKEVRSIYQNL
jgi:hypothetical protein